MKALSILPAVRSLVFGCAVLVAAWLALAAGAGGTYAAAPSDPSPGKSGGPAGQETQGATSVLTGVCASVVGSVVPSPNLGIGGSAFHDVSAVSATDAWAVGGLGSNWLYQHWDGTRWSYVPSTDTGTLYAVQARASNDAWAAGKSWRDTPPMNGLYGIVTHWDGTQWSDSLTLGPYDPLVNNIEMHDVWARAADDAWAVGFFSSIEPEYEMHDAWIFHWNGSGWTGVPTSEPPNAAWSLYAVTSVAANDAWAVGEGNGPLALHWNGTAWSQTALPSLPGAVLLDVAPVSSTEVWAVGMYYPSGSPQTLILRWNGSQWTHVPAPNVPGTANYLSGLSASTTGGVWAVGMGTPGPQTISMHWDGQAWVLLSGMPSGTLSGVAAPEPGMVLAVGYSSTSGSGALAMRLDNNQPRTLPAPVPVATTNTLRGVDAVDSGNIWAVGSYNPEYASVYQIMRWDDDSWDLSPGPTLDMPINGLNDVVALAANDVWAVGYKKPSSPSYALPVPLVLHWDGTQWSQAYAPTSPGYLRSVDAISPTDIWAVGYKDTEQDAWNVLTLHYDGSTWSEVSTPFPQYSGLQFYGVEAIAPDDVWAVGFHTRSSEANSAHWDGTQWTEVPVPTVPDVSNRLRAVSAVAPNDVWAVGYTWRAATGEGQPITLHWNGTQWTSVSAPTVGQGSYLFSVRALSADDVWAAGNYLDNGVQKTLVLRWNGTQWSRVDSPNNGSMANFLNDLAVTGDSIWAVGESYLPTGSATLIERIAPPIYSDVPSSNTFYPFVSCLSCRGILGGYADGTFRPNNNVTRGQLAKILANAAGFSEPVSGQTFEDVPPGSTFYEYIERVAARDIIQGYPCGGEGEPCVPPDNRPYFRPNANATRGQISKIVAIARGYIDPMSTQTFEDVPVGSTFHVWIENLATRGIMGGYVCGSAGEPCGPENRPYFRPNNNATRGQTAKIVSNTFFPECSP